MTFRLYPVAQRWWSLTDYGAVLSVVERLKPDRVLEFGPGSSTLALVEGGALAVDSCEDNPRWQEVYKGRLADRFPSRVAIVPYTWADPLSIAGIDDRRYDLALIDGPLETPRRPVVVEYCLQRCEYVMVALECNEGSRLMREASVALASKYVRPIEITETGPLAGAFALIGPS